MNYLPPSNAANLLRHIHPRHADDNKSWQAICIALKNCGIPYADFEAWSLTEKHRDKQQIRRAWENLKCNHGIGTLRYYAKNDGMVSTKTITRIADGEVAFQHLTALYKEWSELDLDCELWERSPYRLNHSNGLPDVQALLKNLYAPDDLIFIGSPRIDYPPGLPDDQREGYKLQCQQNAIKPAKEHFATLTHLPELFRPNPLTGNVAILSNGGKTLVGDDCVAKFRFAVLEFDQRPLTDQYAFFMAMLDQNWPIASLTFSGNKSIHCLLQVDCSNAAEWKDKVEDKLFRQYLEPLGCDRACKNESRMSRLPGAVRDNGKIQRLLYFNPFIKG